VQSTFVRYEELASLCCLGGFFHDSVNPILNQKSEDLWQKTLPSSGLRISGLMDSLTVDLFKSVAKKR
jgi:hypothetical protein